MSSCTLSSTKRTVLVIDGNGKRGIYSYYVAEQLQVHCKFKPDLIVGVSAGAFVGALYATGQITHITEDTMVSLGSTIRTNGQQRIPWLNAMIKGPVKTEIFYKLFGGLKLGDVKIPLCILVDGIDDSPRIFDSSDPIDADIELYKILDATTAIPAVFPSVPIGDKHYIDPVLISTSPTIIGYFLALDHFKTSEFRMISIGTTQTNDRENPNSNPKPKSCDGILDHFRHGLFTSMISRRDNVMEVLFKKTMKDNFLRLEEFLPRDNKSSFQVIHDHCKAASLLTIKRGMKVMRERRWIVI
jgi:predicted acylesterase/phospholipase RssA